MKRFGRKISLLSLIVFLTLFAVPVFAADAGPIPDTFDVNQLKADGQKLFVPKVGQEEANKEAGIINVLVKATGLFIKIIASVCLVVFIIGALLTIASEGKEDMLEKGKNTMVYAIIGLVISLMAFVIVTFVQSIFF